LTFSKPAANIARWLWSDGTPVLDRSNRRARCSSSWSALWRSARGRGDQRRRDHRCHDFVDPLCGRVIGGS